MQDAALIQVEVTEHSGDKTYGTAYLINHDRAITALHVVENYKEIQFNFSNGSQLVGTDHFDVVYPNTDYDLAILRFLPSEDSPLPEVKPVLIGAKTDVGDDWYGVGFPKFAENGEVRSREELKGDCNYLPEKEDCSPFLAGTDWLNLTCDKKARLALWGGVSGAPVFLVENKHLVAVITEHDTATDNTHFQAAPLQRFFADEEFTRHFAISRQIGKLTEATLALLQDKNSEPLLRAFNESRAEDVISSFQSGDIEDFFERIGELPKEVGSRLASQFALQFLPHFFIDQSVVIDECLLGSDIIDLECVKDVAAECAMAAFSGRQANLACGAGEDAQLHVARGGSHYALGPETGVGHNDLALQQCTHQLLSTSALDDNIQNRLARFAAGYTNATEYANRKLARDNKKGRHYYYIVALDKASAEGSAHLEKIKVYKKSYPSLIFINLRKSNEVPMKEGALYEFLPELITG